MKERQKLFSTDRACFRTVLEEGMWRKTNLNKSTKKTQIGKNGWIYCFRLTDLLDNHKGLKPTGGAETRGDIYRSKGGRERAREVRARGEEILKMKGGDHLNHHGREPWFKRKRRVGGGM